MDPPPHAAAPILSSAGSWLQHALRCPTTVCVCAGRWVYGVGIDPAATPRCSPAEAAYLCGGGNGGGSRQAAERDGGGPVEPGQRQGRGEGQHGCEAGAAAAAAGGGGAEGGGAVEHKFGWRVWLAVARQPVVLGLAATTIIDGFGKPV